MIDHPISIAIPSKIDWIGARHGLLMAKPAPDGDYWLKEAEILTRGGRIVPVGEQPNGRSIWEFRYNSLPRPVLYMHPLASRIAEDESGMDRSGYCILYGVMTRYDNARFPAYLRHMTGPYSYSAVGLAYTPDSMGQAVAFRNEETVLSPLKLFSDVSTSGETVALPEGVRIGGFHSASLDGRLRMRAAFPGLIDFFRINLWYNGGNPSKQVLGMSAYSLSGERGSITATQIEVAQPACYYSDETEEDVGGRIASAVILLPAFGSCTDPNKVDLTLRITRKPDGSRPDHSLRTEIIVCDIDADDDIGQPSFLSLSFRREVELWRTDDARGSASVQWGGPCEWGGEILSTVAGTESTIERIENVIRRDDTVVTLSGWGAESSAEFLRRIDTDSLHVLRNVNGELVEDSYTSEADKDHILRLEGSVIWEKGEGWNYMYGLNLDAPIYESPKALILSERDLDRLTFRFAKDPTMGDGTEYVDAKIVLMRFSAEGVSALALSITEGVIRRRPDGRSYLEEGTITHRIVVGRIFGFGISIPGRELTNEEINSQLFIAYDPLEKKFSDIYTHPIYFQ